MKLNTFCVILKINLSNYKLIKTANSYQLFVKHLTSVELLIRHLKHCVCGLRRNVACRSVIEVNLGDEEIIQDVR